MSAIADHRNPFLRRNPYSLPQTVPSEGRPKSQPYSRNSSPSFAAPQATPTRPPPHFPAAFGRSQQYNAPQPHHLRKKNIREMDNPFQRKHLLSPTQPSENTPPFDMPHYQPPSPFSTSQAYQSQTNDYSRYEYTVSYSQTPPMPQTSGNRLVNNYTRNPSLTRIPEEQPSSQRQQYSNTDLKLKLKSQTYLEASPRISQPTSTQRQDPPLTLGKSSAVLPSDRGTPGTIMVRGKTYHIQPMQLR